MRKRGQSHLLYYLIALLLLGAIALSYKAVKDVGERQADAETQVLVSSLQAEILKQAGREQGAMSNLSLSVPGTISEVCFFDSGAPSDSLKNIELTQLYAGDQTKLFLRMKGSYLAFPLDKAAFKENPLCIAPVQGTLNLALASTGKAALVSGGGISKCTTVMQSGAPEDKVDLVFLGYGYGSQEDFSRDAFRFANNILLSFAPFSENRVKFNVYRVDQAEFACSTKDYISCDQFQVQLAASNCPMDYAVVLVDRSALADFVRPVRSSTMNGLVKINTADRPFVIAHEFGHIFGLADEYVDQAYFAGRFDPGLYPNCALAPCASWGEIAGAGCYQGCSLNSYFRPTETSIMRDLSSPDFGPVSTQEIERRLDRYE